MTLSIKERPESDSLAKPSLSPDNSGSASQQNSRSNPVCLEVAVTVRGLPGAGAATPAREESRTVIVFDNGAVLRLSQILAPGQSMILSNAQGREVICKIVNTRKLPNIKGYVEVEFAESASDFWGIHQPPERTSASASKTSVTGSSAGINPVADQSLGAATIKPPVLLPVPSSAPSSAKVPALMPVNEMKTVSDGAPTFDDITGLMTMSPKVTSPTRPPDSGSASQPSIPNRNKEKQVVDTAKIVFATEAGADTPQETPVSKASEALQVPAQKHNPPADFQNIGRLSSSLGAGNSPGEGTFGRMPMIAGGVALLVIVLGGGFFLMHRQSGPSAIPATNVVVQPSSPTVPAANDTSQSADTAQAIQNQAPSVTQAVENQVPAAAQSVSAVSRDNVRDSAPLESTKPGQARKNDDASPPAEHAASGRQPVPDLKMSSPTSPRRDFTKLGEVPTAPAIAEATASVPVSESLRSVVRTESQPAPPRPAILTESVSNIVSNPKLLISTRAVYPQAAKQANVQGTVVLAAEVDEKGNVSGAKAISGPAMLRAAAISNVMQWKYQPALVNGNPASGEVTINIDFKLN